MFLLRSLAILALLLSVASCKGNGASPATVADARAATDSWIAMVDAGQLAQSWTEAASYFKAGIDSPHWEKLAASVRDPLGKVVSRTLKSATPTKSVPGAPDGEYVIFQFDTVFEHKATAVETIKPMKDTDGHWRVSGYHID